MEDILKNKKNPTTQPPHYVAPPLLTEKEIDIEGKKSNKEFIKTSLLMSKAELDAANESADQKKQKIVKGIIDPTPGLIIDDQ